MSLDLTRHPCFSTSARLSSARVHLPVAPLCNIQCNYCKRGYDCVNESRPGVSTAVLSPGQALVYLEEMVLRDPRITVVGIAGPGDPFANAEATMETLRLVRARFPEMLLCIASNGWNIAPYVAELASLQVSHVTLTINAVDPEIGQAIYRWAREQPKVYRGREAAAMLIERQLAAVKALKEHGVTVKVNSILCPGINDEHLPEVARRVAELGADILNCIPIYPVEDTPFAQIPSPTHAQLAAVRAEVARHMPVMAHCARCRADAAGLMGEAFTDATALLLKRCAELPIHPHEERPYVAVATREGVLVNQHLGEAERLAIFRQREGGFEQIDSRVTPSAGGGRSRWQAMAELLSDCRALLAASAGDAPRSVLAAQGIRVVMMEGLIEEGLDAVYKNVEVRAPLRRGHQCGAGCAGGGQGCS